MKIKWKVVRIPAGDITNLHYNFVVAKPLVYMKARRRYSPKINGMRSCKDWLGRGWGRSPSSLRQRAAGEIFFEDRLGYPAISMNFKTESFTYVILLINIEYMFL